ncbi:carbon-nitrogen hydrolase family protein [candidate division KSB1 bacterium]|nr:carbon-nitrogen hydrolase family protein [candidate division KSB1 bacterium]
MANYVRISTLGPPFRMENPGTGQAAVDQTIAFWKTELAQVLPERPDLILLPEACDRYQVHTREESLAYYRTRGNQILDFFADVAQKHKCHIAYSAAREMPDGTWRNSTQIIGRDGQVLGIYNKNHVVITETEEGGILCGTNAQVIDCDFGRVGCAICFDLNFDEIRLKYVKSRPDLILFSSMYHGGLMQGYWAYSCRAHFVTAVARLPCSILSPLGHVIASSTNYFDFVTATVNLDCKVAHLDFNREKLAALKAKYGPQVSIFDPGYLASVLVTSETHERSSAEMIEEFEIELLDDYMQRSLAHHHNPKNRG